MSQIKNQSNKNYINLINKLSVISKQMNNIHIFIQKQIKLIKQLN